MKRFIISLISVYQRYLSFDTGLLAFLAPGGACKYPLRCSEYTKEQIEEKGVLKGVLIGIRRLLTCI